MLAQFKVQNATEMGEPAKKLYLKTFEPIDRDISLWQERPESSWPLLATVLADRIIMYPIHANPHTKRYLRPKHGRFTTVIYEDNANGELPSDPQQAAAYVALRLASNIFEMPGDGLGLIKDLDTVWQALSLIPQAEILVIGRKSKMRLDGRKVFIDQNELDSLRRAFNRTKTRGRDIIQRTKHGFVYDEVLTKIYPEKFQRIERKTPPLVQIRSESAVQTTTRERAERRTNVQTVRNQVDVLAVEAPTELLKLHAEIERATLTAMIGKYRDMLEKKLGEAHWQRFFEQHKFVLSLAFARPVELSHTQFHAQGSGLTGTGAQIGDFLFKEQGQALAIVEIKTPDAPLMLTTPYRKPHVFAPHSELSGAITQVLHQQSEVRTRWHGHANDNPSLRSSRADVIRCIVLAGRRPVEEHELRCFEVFRNACKDVEVVTFDELLLKLEYLQQHLQPVPEEVPF
jgi:hypothetical protein